MKLFYLIQNIVTPIVLNRSHTPEKKAKFNNCKSWRKFHLIQEQLSTEDEGQHCPISECIETIV